MPDDKGKPATRTRALTEQETVLLIQSGLSLKADPTTLAVLEVAAQLAALRGLLERWYREWAETQGT